MAIEFWCFRLVCYYDSLFGWVCFNGWALSFRLVGLVLMFIGLYSRPRLWLGSGGFGPGLVVPDFDCSVVLVFVLILWLLAGFDSGGLFWL